MKHTPRPKGSVLAALDVGSSKIACLIARIIDDEGSLEVLGVGHQASAGIRSGTVTDLQAAENAIRQTVHAAENMAAETLKGYPLREVVVNLPGIHATSRMVNADVGIAGHEVTDNDVRRALARAQDQIFDQSAELIHTIPVSCSIDGNQGIREPRGMVGQNLHVDIHLVSGDSSALRNLASAIERSHLDITALCSASYAAGLSSLVEDEMDLGATVIDIGGGITSFAVFSAGALIYCDAIALGGSHVTSDIARGLTTPVSAAERLKTLYGSAMATNADESEMIDVPPLGEENGGMPNHMPRSLLVGIIQPRMEEIFEHVRARLQDSGVASYMGRRVVLTGGASQLPGLRDLGQRVLDKQVRLGRPIRLHGLPDAASSPAFSTSAGLLVYISERFDEMPAEILAQVEPGGVWERVRMWLKENW
ncbi:MAG: cell division protein FtsA [Alphaproteobacteria bacterium]|nr:cell division protein FtsA [Alphaproteobacteria bacterium]